MEQLAKKLTSKIWIQNTSISPAKYEFEFENNLKGSITERFTFIGHLPKTESFSITVKGNEIIFETSLWVDGAKYILKELPNGFEFIDEQNQVFKSLI